MNSKLKLAIAVMLALAITSVGYAFTYLMATTAMDVTVAGEDIATAGEAASQPDWDSVLTPEAAGNETLRPVLAGDETAVSDQFPALGEHWDKVDEATSDGDSTYVKSDSNAWQEDLYNIADHSAGSGNISYVKVYIVAASTETPTQANTYVHIKTNGAEYNGSQETTTTSYATYSHQWDTNPQTGEAWTWDEIDALQIGVGLRRSSTVEKDTRCTQVYAEVNYGGGIALCGDVPIGDLFDVTPHVDFSGDLEIKAYVTNTGALAKAYQYLNMKLYLEGSVEAGETPNYRLLTLDNGGVTFNLKDYSPGTYTLSVTGGSYCLVSTDTGEWEEGWTVTPEFYCEIQQR